CWLSVSGSVRLLFVLAPASRAQPTIATANRTHRVTTRRRWHAANAPRRYRAPLTSPHDAGIRPRSNTPAPSPLPIRPGDVTSRSPPPWIERSIVRPPARRSSLDNPQEGNAAWRTVPGEQREEGAVGEPMTRIYRKGVLEAAGY